MKRPKVAFFDLNHTCLQMGEVSRSEIEDYITHINQSSWSPLKFPEHWNTLPCWYDVPTAIWHLRQYKKVICVTLSNNPIAVQIEQLRYAKLGFNWMVPLEAYHVFKPNAKAYQIACNLLQVDPKDALMVTANKDFGDIAGARSVGMQAVWIDRKREDKEHPYKNLMDLVGDLE